MISRFFQSGSAHVRALQIRALRIRALQIRAMMVLAVLGVGLSACAGNEPKKLRYVETPVETLYLRAVENLERSQWEEAALRFDEVERQHPYSVWARRAMLMAAYSQYEANNYDEAILAAERFLSLHPGNRYAPYAHYLIAVSYYEQIQDVGRDQRTTQNAMQRLEEIIRRFPASEYARDARLKLDMTRDHLAGKEMMIGRYYLKREQHVAAINRFRNVIENYQTTSHVPEALHRLTEAYLSMGVVPEAQTAAAVLGHNFPGSEWYEDSYSLVTQAEAEPSKNQGSWISRAFSSVF